MFSFTSSIFYLASFAFVYYIIPAIHSQTLNDSNTLTTTIPRKNNRTQLAVVNICHLNASWLPSYPYLPPTDVCGIPGGSTFNINTLCEISSGNHISQLGYIYRDTDDPKLVLWKMEQTFSRHRNTSFGFFKLSLNLGHDLKKAERLFNAPFFVDVPPTHSMLRVCGSNNSALTYGTNVNVSHSLDCFNLLNMSTATPKENIIKYRVLIMPNRPIHIYVLSNAGYYELRVLPPTIKHLVRIDIDENKSNNNTFAIPPVNVILQNCVNHSTFSSIHGGKYLNKTTIFNKELWVHKGELCRSVNDPGLYNVLDRVRNGTREKFRNVPLTLQHDYHNGARKKTLEVHMILGGPLTRSVYEVNVTINNSVRTVAREIITYHRWSKPEILNFLNFSRNLALPTEIHTRGEIPSCSNHNRSCQMSTVDIVDRTFNQETFTQDFKIKQKKGGLQTNVSFTTAIHRHDAVFLSVDCPSFPILNMTCLKNRAAIRLIRRVAKCV